MHNVLVLGSGGREHTLCWKLLQSELCKEIFIAPGNAGTQQIAQNVNLDLSDFRQIAEFVDENKIEYLIVGPEQPLVDGIVDYFQENLPLLRVLGPGKSAAMLEGSKDFAKEFMAKYKIPTAAYQSFDQLSLDEGLKFLENSNGPYVLKADGLAAGKGVLIIEDKEEAKTALKEMLGGKFGEASNKVVIEEFLDGIEYSVFALTDGQNYFLLPEAKDYKRIGEGDVGLNTGGMGAVSPVPFVDKELMQKTIDQIVEPTIKGIQQENMNYKGFVFFGIIKVGNDPFVIEYNVRMGDPETEVVIPRLENDFMELVIATFENKLSQIKPKFKAEAATTLMLVSGGYPESYEKGKSILIPEDLEGSLVFHAGTKWDNKELLTNGGRVIAITSFASDFNEAITKSSKLAERIHFDKKYFRSDIGFDL